MESYIVIDGWKSKIRFSSAHFIPEYKKCGRLHGHTYAINLKIFGIPDEKGIIIDFSILKNILKNIVKELDHKMLIPEKCKVVTIERKSDNIIITSLGRKYIFPLCDCALLPIDSTSAEQLSKYVLEKFLEKISLSKRIYKINIGIDEGFGQSAWITKTFCKE